MEKGLFKVYRALRLRDPCLIVSWQTHDVGHVGSQVVDFLLEKLGGQETAEVDPIGFFPFGGVRFKDDMVQTIESKFWACEKESLLIFRSDEPAFEHLTFLNSLLDFGETCSPLKEVYTISGALSPIPHTRSRRLLTVFNQNECKARLDGYGLEGMTWEGPPAISSYLIWLARRRGLPGISLWPEVPFYLAALHDAEAARSVLSFLNHRFNLSLHLGRFEIEALYQNERIAQLRRENTETDRWIDRIENGQVLGEEEQLELTRQIYDLFRKRI